MAKQTHSDAEYVNLKQQYDSLLEKNQSDLIKIKQKEKSLNETIEKVKKEYEDRECGLKERIESLEKELESERQSSKKQGTLVVDVKSKEDEKIADLEADIRRLMDENISLTADHTSLAVNLDTQQRKNQQLSLQVSNLRNFIASLQADLKEKTLQKRPAVIMESIHTITDFPYVSQEQTKSMKQAIQYLRKQLEKQQSHCSQMTFKLKQVGEQTRRTLDKQRKMVNLLRKRQNELTAALTELDKLKLSAKPKRKKTESEQNQCQKCNELKQEVHILKDMVRSSQVMVRVKQIEVEKYRIHNSQDISGKDTNKSLTKHQSKFPPLKKK